MRKMLCILLVGFLLVFGCAGKGAAGGGDAVENASGEPAPTGGAEVAHENADAEPEAAASLCEETDGGYDLRTRGNTTLFENGEKTWEKEDYCIDSGTLVEYYCEIRELTHESVRCPCKNGVCTPVLDYAECVESDAGNDKYEKGGITVVNHYTDGSTEEVYSVMDTCLGSNIVTEYYCKDNGKYGKAEWTCMHCTDGACTE